MMRPEEMVQAENIATQLALAELLRLAIGELVYTDDRNEFVRRLKVIEAAAVDGITNRRTFDRATDEDEAFIRESATAFVTKLMTSIRHPADTPGS